MHITPLSATRRTCSAEDVDTIKLSRDLTALGYTAQELGRMARSGELHRIRRGAYADEPAPTDAGDNHRQLIETTVRLSSPSCVVSHLSAAVLHELPLWDDLLGRVHLTRDRVTGAKLRRYSQLHVGALAADEITEVDGIRVTTVARTAVDVARTSPSYGR
jgi:predicted transcriptional regulator of viral defense system